MDDPMVHCPFDLAHVCKQSRFQKHLVKCRKNHPDSKLEPCPYNATEYIHPDKLVDHLKVCTKAKLLEGQKYSAEFMKESYLDAPFHVTSKKIPDLIPEDFEQQGFGMNYNDELILERSVSQMSLNSVLSDKLTVKSRLNSAISSLKIGSPIGRDGTRSSSLRSVGRGHAMAGLISILQQIEEQDFSKYEVKENTDGDKTGKRVNSEECLPSELRSSRKTPLDSCQEGTSRSGDPSELRQECSFLDRQPKALELNFVDCSSDEGEEDDNDSEHSSNSTIKNAQQSPTCSRMSDRKFPPCEFFDPDSDSDNSLPISQTSTSCKESAQSTRSSSTCSRENQNSVSRSSSRASFLSLIQKNFLENDSIVKGIPKAGESYDFNHTISQLNSRGRNYAPRKNHTNMSQPGGCGRGSSFNSLHGAKPLFNPANNVSKKPFSNSKHSQNFNQNFPHSSSNNRGQSNVKPLFSQSNESSFSCQSNLVGRGSFLNQQNSVGRGSLLQQVKSVGRGSLLSQNDKVGTVNLASCENFGSGENLENRVSWSGRGGVDKQSSFVGRGSRDGLNNSFGRGSGNNQFNSFGRGSGNSQSSSFGRGSGDGQFNTSGRGIGDGQVNFIGRGSGDGQVNSFGRGKVENHGSGVGRGRSLMKPDVSQLSLGREDRMGQSSGSAANHYNNFEGKSSAEISHASFQSVYENFRNLQVSVSYSPDKSLGLKQESTQSCFFVNARPTPGFAPTLNNVLATQTEETNSVTEIPVELKPKNKSKNKKNNKNKKKKKKQKQTKEISLPVNPTAGSNSDSLNPPQAPAEAAFKILDKSMDPKKYFGSDADSKLNLKQDTIEDNSESKENVPKNTYKRKSKKVTFSKKIVAHKWQRKDPFEIYDQFYSSVSLSPKNNQSNINLNEEKETNASRAKSAGEMIKDVDGKNGKKKEAGPPLAHASVNCITVSPSQPHCSSSNPPSNLSFASLHSPQKPKLPGRYDHLSGTGYKFVYRKLNHKQKVIHQKKRINKLGWKRINQDNSSTTRATNNSFSSPVVPVFNSEERSKQTVNFNKGESVESFSQNKSDFCTAIKRSGNHKAHWKKNSYNQTSPFGPKNVFSNQQSFNHPKGSQCQQISPSDSEKISNNKQSFKNPSASQITFLNKNSYHQISHSGSGKTQNNQQTHNHPKGSQYHQISHSGFGKIPNNQQSFKNPSGSQTTLCNKNSHHQLNHSGTRIISNNQQSFKNQSSSQMTLWNKNSYHQTSQPGSRKISNNQQSFKNQTSSPMTLWNKNSYHQISQPGSRKISNNQQSFKNQTSSPMTLWNKNSYHQISHPGSGKILNNQQSFKDRSESEMTLWNKNSYHQISHSGIGNISNNQQSFEDSHHLHNSPWGAGKTTAYGRGKKHQANLTPHQKLGFCSRDPFSSSLPNPFARPIAFGPGESSHLISIPSSKS